MTLGNQTDETRIMNNSEINNAGKITEYYSDINNSLRLEKDRRSIVANPSFNVVLEHLSKNNVKIEGTNLLHAFASEYFENKREEILKEYIGTNPLDVACGTLFFYRKMLSKGWSGQINGYDISNSMLSLAKSYITSDQDNNHVTKMHKDMYIMENSLGQEVWSLESTINEIKNKPDNLRLIQGNIKEDTLPEGDYSIVTAFSGPICYFPTDEQETIFRKLTERSDTVAFTIKSAGAEIIKNNQEMYATLTSILNAMWDEPLGQEEKNFFKYGANRLLSKDQSSISSREIPHEKGDFCSYVTFLEESKEWASKADLNIIEEWGYGFQINVFPETLLEKYLECKQDAGKLKNFNEKYQRIEELFSKHAPDYCENVLILATKHKNISPDYSKPRNGSEYYAITNKKVSIN